MFDLVQGHDQHADVFTSCQMIVRLFISVLQHPGASCGERVLSTFPKTAKIPNFPYKKAVQMWLR